MISISHIEQSNMAGQSDMFVYIETEIKHN